MDTEKALCSICFINDSKYTCPACGTKTCSIECVRRHKKQTECSGLKDQTKFVAKNDFVKDPSHLNRDYNFLLSVDRHIQLGKSDVKTNARNVFRNGPGNNINRGNKRFKPNPENEDKRINAINEVYTQKPPTTIRRENTLVIQLPSGMHRAVSNKTGYDKKSKTYIWTIEWVFLGQDDKELSRFLSYRLKEHLLVKDAVPMNILNSHASFEKESLSFFLENVLSKDRSKLSLLEMDKNTSLSESLKSKIVLEYPTIYIKSGEVSKDFIIGEAEAYNIEESSSESSSSSDSDSDSDSDSSDSSDSNSGDSDDDSSNDAPEESSSKGPLGAQDASNEAVLEKEGSEPIEENKLSGESTDAAIAATPSTKLSTSSI